MRARTPIVLTLVAALSGCAACDTVPPDAVTDCSAQIVPGIAATDVLFIVDDSASMAGEQAELAANLGTFIDELLGSAIALDVRIGVTNTSVSDFSSTSGADGPATYLGGVFAGKPYPRGSVVAVLDPDGVVTPGRFAFDPVVYGTATGGWGGHRILSSASTPAADLIRYFKANVRHGIQGSGKEQPLRAMRMAIDKAEQLGGENLGFLRANARLAVVIVTDEDDCSESAAPFIVGDAQTGNDQCHSGSVKASGLDPLDDFVTLLDTTGGEPIVAVIAGFAQTALLEPTGCSSASTSSSDDPTRLDAFLGKLDAAHPGRTFKDSICNDFGPSLLRIAEVIIPQTMPLQQSPQDYRMMAVAIQRPGSATPIPCPMEPFGSAAAADPATGVIYNTAPPGGLPSLTFQNQCRLGLGDRVDLRIVCVR